MFSWFRDKKQSPSAMDALVRATYGDKTTKTANVPEAIKLAHSELLRERFDAKDVTRFATELNSGPVPYSTHDLAASVALALLRKVPLSERMALMDVQLRARLTVANWVSEGKVVPLLAGAFEETLYKEYRPSAGPDEPLKRPEQTRLPQAHIIRAKIANLVRGALSDRSSLLELVKPNCAIVLDNQGDVSLRWLSLAKPDLEKELSDAVAIALLRQISAFKTLLETCAQEAKSGTLDDTFFFGPGRILFDRLAIDVIREMELFLRQANKQ
jgi:hypothetical protein